MRLSAVLCSAALLVASAAPAQEPDRDSAPSSGSAEMDRAYFAMGCFWCGEADFEKVPGVKEVVSGYAGGTTRNPTYEQVGAGGTGHIESVSVRYDPAIISYGELLDIFWRNVDPLDDRGQFCDKGESYVSAIFPANAAERRAAEASLARVQQKLGEPVATKIIAAKTFWRAEEYHQDYYKKNPVRYSFYRDGCGRDARLKELTRRLEN
jgi:peptide-methionine (S)-S-oxide reductase|tara:strand:+ start:26686 stop:27312 length:627 start_codon:yes stop_codon:yes gene_type:complete